MVIELTPGQDWTYEPPAGGHANLTFASASSPDNAAVAFYFKRGGGEIELVEKVWLKVPHSWWMPGQKIGAESYVPGDVLTVRAVRGKVTLRIDLDEHRLED